MTTQELTMNISQAIEFLENEKDGSNVYDMEAVIELLKKLAKYEDL